MPSVRLTNSLIPKLDPPKTGNQVLYQDNEQRGLAVRVTRGGARSFIVDRNTGRGRIRVTLGPCDAMTVMQARMQAAEAVGAIGRGATGQQVKAGLARAEGAIEPGALTVEQVFEEYVQAKRGRLSARTIYDYRRLLGLVPPKDKPDPRGQTGYLSDWRRAPIAALTREDIKSKFLSIKSPAQANYAMRLMRALFNYAEGALEGKDGKPIITDNPVRVLTKAKLWHRQAPKRDVIRPIELRAWWAAVEALSNGNAETVRDWLHFILLTGLRRSEASGLRWEDVDLRARTVTLPTTKNRDPHTLPLSDYLLEMLQRREAARISEYVFPGSRGELAEPKKQIAKVIAASGVKFSAHTLRRTFGTIAESLDIPAYAVKRLLNHRMSGDVTFQHYLVIDVERLREPMQRITHYVLRAAGEKQGGEILELQQTR